jgi:hypothetical protein
MSTRRVGYGLMDGVWVRFSHYNYTSNSLTIVLHKTLRVLAPTFPASVSKYQIPTCSYEEIEDGYGTFIGVSSAKKHQGLAIPFYTNTVIEGKNFDFECHPPVTCRTAEIRFKPKKETLWLERHMHLTQLFMGLGGKEPFLMVLGKPTHDRSDLTEEQRNLPDLSTVKAFIIPPGMYE